MYGLDSIFEAARRERLPRPETADQLRVLLHEHLYVEGDEDSIRLDEHSLRVRTDDDEVELAYFFLDDHIVAAAPQRLTYLLHPSWPLPEETDHRAAFAVEAPVNVVTEPGPDTFTTFAVFLTFYDGQSLAVAPTLAFPRRRPARARPTPARRTTRRRRAVAARASGPASAQRLRRGQHRTGIGPLQPMARLPWPDLPDEHAAAHREAVQRVDAAQFTDRRQSDASLLRVTGHLAQMAMHCGESFGYQQWYLFDTRWAASHPHLAQSLLRYAHHWDPLDDRWPGDGDAGHRNQAGSPVDVRSSARRSAHVDGVSLVAYVGDGVPA
ncbi:hypothetical protein E1193_00080 [Micromonospora sp. KC606]|uniref:hypothetical protein n=1 Tax=Micromonospora sp. KC606 TaxID=2530379 RepID=UPI0010447A59|nr:hypothetical protein [Micromonospora sp. KC606]TDC86111.1 hypothetical protein E1193_00080 [Micromonospora sp. KC606]